MSPNILGSINRINNMSFDWPTHPLFDQLCEKAALLLPKLGFQKN